MVTGQTCGENNPSLVADQLPPFSAFDDTIAPPGKHNVTVWGQWHPYELSTGERWDDIAGREADKIVAQVEAAAPGFTSSIEQVHVKAKALQDSA